MKRHLNRARLDHTLLQLERAAGGHGRRRLLMTDCLPASLADVAAASDMDVVDAASNMKLHWPGKLYVEVRGVTPLRPAEASAGNLTTPTGLQVIFALLAERDNSEVRTYRGLADVSGVSLAAVARVHAELQRRGFVEVGPDGRRAAPKE